jgi:hypothetical protein
MHQERERGWLLKGSGTTSSSDEEKIVAYSQHEPIV